MGIQPICSTIGWTNSKGEDQVEEQIIAFLRDGGELHGALAESVSEAHETETLLARASSLAERWPRMPFVEKRQRLQGLHDRVTLNPGSLGIAIRTAHLAEILRSGEEIDARELNALPDQPILVLTIAARLKRTGIEKKLLIEKAGKRPRSTADTSLLKLIARAHELQNIFARGDRSISKMADAEGDPLPLVAQ